MGVNSDVNRLFDPTFVPLMTTVATKCGKVACDWVGRVSQRVVACKKVYSSRKSKEGKVLIFSLVSVLVILKSVLSLECVVQWLKEGTQQN